MGMLNERNYVLLQLRLECEGRLGPRVLLSLLRACAGSLRLLHLDSDRLLEVVLKDAQLPRLHTVELSGSACPIGCRKRHGWELEWPRVAFTCARCDRLSAAARQ